MKSTTTKMLICSMLLTGQSIPNASAAPSRPEPTFELTPTPNKVVLVITRNTAESALVKAIGKANVQRKAIGIGEGETEPGTLIYPSKADREISIIWSDRKNNRYPETVNIWGPKSLWRTAKGLHTGMSLVELQKLNGKPFKMSGFDWDYGGRITDWNGGKLERDLVQPSKASVTVGLNYGPDQKVPIELSGEKEILSNNPQMLKLNPVIESLYVNYDQSARKSAAANKNSN